MAEASSIKFRGDGIFLTLNISREEYELLGNSTSDILLVPADSKSLNMLLTTGKLGNSRRLMLPKKILDRLNVKIVEKKSPGKVFSAGGNVYIIARISKAHKKDDSKPTSSALAPLLS